MRTFVLIVNDGAEIAATNWYATAWPWHGKVWLSWRDGCWRLLVFDGFDAGMLKDARVAVIKRWRWEESRQSGARTSDAARIEWQDGNGRLVLWMLVNAMCIDGWPEKDCNGKLYVYDDDGGEMPIEDAIGSVGALRESILLEVGRIGSVRKVWEGEMKHVNGRDGLGGRDGRDG